MNDRTDRHFVLFNGLVSVAAVGFLAWLLLLRDAGGSAIDLRFMPAINAALNGTSAVFLVAGLLAIRRGNRTRHKRLMISAFTASALFLVGYVAYHYVHGDTRYAGVGLLRAVYFAILISHVLLSMLVLPLALSMFYLASRQRFAAHKRLGRWTLPIWLYVSVTGVIIYFMLHVL